MAESAYEGGVSGGMIRVYVAPHQTTSVKTHTPLSFVIHPLWLYVRNAVVRPVTDPAQAPAIRSYVYEATPTFDDMLDFHPAGAGRRTAYSTR